MRPLFDAFVYFSKFLFLEVEGWVRSPGGTCRRIGETAGRRKDNLNRATEPYSITVLDWRVFCYYYSHSMAVNTQFSIATHIMASLGYASGEEINSTRIAGSVNTSSSFVRRILAKLSRAGLVETATGKNGACWLARPPRGISLLEIYRAVEAPKAFAIHQYPVEKRCIVSCHIKSALGRVLDKTQQAMEQRLSRISLAQVVADLHKK